jgi:hypothetical protein
MRLLVIGGTGFIGRFVVRQLISQGHEVAIFHRGRTRTDIPLAVKQFVGNRNQLEQHRSTLSAFSPSSDAYATGEVLVALLQSGFASHNQRNLRRGIEFLLRTQQDDGSWFAESRSMPVQEYFESGFPHSRSQFISCAATSWATLALLTYESRAHNKLTHLNPGGAQ